MEKRDSSADQGSLQTALAEREQLIADSLSRERALVEDSMSGLAERTAWWEDLITETRRGAYLTQLTSYQSMTRSMAGLLGGTIRDQAKLMIPFEIAEATKEFARFLGTRDPAALASSLKHALAAKQYAAAAKAGSQSGSSGQGGGGGLGGGGRGAATAEGKAQEESERRTRLIVNVGRQVGIVDTYEFARMLIAAINENIRDDVVLEVQT